MKRILIQCTLPKSLSGMVNVAADERCYQTTYFVYTLRSKQASRTGCLARLGEKQHSTYGAPCVSCNDLSEVMVTLSSVRTGLS